MAKRRTLLTYDKRSLDRTYNPAPVVFFFVTPAQLEGDLFGNERSKCDFRSQPYHSGKPKRLTNLIFQELNRAIQAD